MPYKLRDPGVMLSFDGEETIDQQRYEVIKLAFAPSVGLTPQNIYRVFVEASTAIRAMRSRIRACPVSP